MNFNIHSPNFDPTLANRLISESCRTIYLHITAILESKSLFFVRELSSIVFFGRDCIIVCIRFCVFGLVPFFSGKRQRRGRAVPSPGPAAAARRKRGRHLAVPGQARALVMTGTSTAAARPLCDRELGGRHGAMNQAALCSCAAPGTLELANDNDMANGFVTAHVSSRTLRQPSDVRLHLRIMADQYFLGILRANCCFNSTEDPIEIPMMSRPCMCRSSSVALLSMLVSPSQQQELLTGRRAVTGQ